ncbi:MAG: Ig-like domain-containing protein [Candidatus Thermoplasmatota archaeon]|nr:Ig-like domain-containing protein [Candidatus Thermoplasmatota archaeon]
MKLITTIFVLGIVFILSSSTLINAEGTIDKDWEKTYSGTSTEDVHSFQRTSDGGFIFSGSSHSYSADNVSEGCGTYRGSIGWVVKTNSQGIKQWEKTFSEISDSNEVQQTFDGGYIIIGDDLKTIYLIKINSYGIKEWYQIFSGSSKTYPNNFGDSVKHSSDGGYIITGDYELRYLWLIKTDSSGNEIWNKTFFGALDENCGNYVQQTSDGGYSVVGDYGYIIREISGNTSINCGVWLIKTDSSGNRLWDKNFGGLYYENGYYIEQTSDGGYIISGRYGSYYQENYDGPIWDFWLIKTDSSGNIEWDKKYGGDEKEIGYSVKQTSDGGYITTGQTYSYGKENSDVYVVKTDSNGNEEWSTTLGGSGDDVGKSIVEINENTYVVMGETHNGSQWDAYMAKFTYTGIIQNEQPSIRILSPAQGTSVSDTLPVIGSASDDTSVEYVQIKIDSESWITVNGNTSWSYNVDTSEIDNGQHTKYARAWDGKTYSELETISIIVNNIDNQENDDSGRTPGFELIIVFCAIALILFLRRNKMKL